MEWQKYIERRNSIFYVSIFDKAYGKMLKENTGFGFSNQLYVHEKGVFTFYKTKEELEQSDRHFVEIIQKNAKKLDEWNRIGDFGQGISRFIQIQNMEL